MSLSANKNSKKKMDSVMREWCNFCSHIKEASDDWKIALLCDLTITWIFYFMDSYPKQFTTQT